MIPDAAIEAAAQAEYETLEADPWETAHPDDKEDYRRTARIALEAALPHL